MKRWLPAILLGIVYSDLLFANLLVYPTRALVTDRKRVVNLALRHTGTKPETYKISLIFFKMKPDGSLEMVKTPKPEDRSAQSILRFSPRKVKLTPNLEQSVRVMLGNTKALKDGDYRAHISFDPMEDTDTPERDTASTSKGLTMELTAKMAVSIPIVYRKGEPVVKVNLTKPKVVSLPNKGKAASLDLVSTGSAYPYGHFYALFTPNSGGEAKQVGLIKGVSSYVPKRNVMVPLTPPAGVNLAQGKLRVEFRDAESDEGASPLATTETALP